MTDYNRLETLLKAHGSSWTFLAGILNISNQALHNRREKKTDFKAHELLTIKDTFRLSDDEIRAIFFVKNVDE